MSEWHASIGNVMDHFDVPFSRFCKSSRECRLILETTRETKKNAGLAIGRVIVDLTSLMCQPCQPIASTVASRRRRVGVRTYPEQGHRGLFWLFFFWDIGHSTYRILNNVRFWDFSETLFIAQTNTQHLPNLAKIDQNRAKIAFFGLRNRINC